MIGMNYCITELYHCLTGTLSSGRPQHELKHEKAVNHTPLEISFKYRFRAESQPVSDRLVLRELLLYIGLSFATTSDPSGCRSSSHLMLCRVNSVCPSDIRDAHLPRVSATAVLVSIRWLWGVWQRAPVALISNRRGGEWTPFTWHSLALTLWSPITQRASEVAVLM